MKALVPAWNPNPWGEHSSDAAPRLPPHAVLALVEGQALLAHRQLVESVSFTVERTPFPAALGTPEITPDDGQRETTGSPQGRSAPTTC